MTVNAGRKATLVLASNLVGAALGYASLLLIGRYFAPAAYGSYLFALSLGGLVAILSNLGLGNAHERHVAQGLEPGRALGVLLRLRVAIGAALLAAFGLAYLAWSTTREAALTDATTPKVLGLALLVQLMSAARQVLFDTWQGQQRVHRIETLRFADTALLLVLLGNAALMLAHLQGRWQVLPGLGAAWADLLGIDAPLGLEASAVLLASCYAVAKAASLVAAWLWSLRDRVEIGPWDRDLARSYLRFVLPLAIMGALALILQFTDSLVLGFFWTAREVGLYGAAQRLSSVAMLGVLAVGAVLFPRFAQLHAAGDAAGEAATFAKAQRYMLLLATPAAAAMVALPREGIHVAVGDQYLEAAPALRILAVWALAIALSMTLSSRLMGAGQTRVLVRAGLINAGGNVALNLLLVPPGTLGLGPAGSAAATLVSTLASYLYMSADSRRRYGTPWIDGHQARILAAGATAFSFWAAAALWFGPTALDRAWELAGWAFVGMAVYALGLAALGELHRQDLEFLRKVAHPRALFTELRGR